MYVYACVTVNWWGEYTKFLTTKFYTICEKYKLLQRKGPEKKDEVILAIPVCIECSYYKQQLLFCTIKNVHMV